MAYHDVNNKSSDGTEPHQQQAGSSTDRDEDQWKHRPPYSIHDNPDDFPVKWKGKCHCGAVEYQLSRDKPLDSKYCHCTTCQRLHGWAAIFHKTDINFTKGHHDLGWYDSTNKSTTHHLPCKVQCAFCRTPIMDEGRNMILLGAAQNHMFYPQRVVDIKDGLPKFKGLSNHSPLIDEETGEEIVPDSEPEPERKKPKREH
ncbi:Mss4-like protein [Lasiosphaeris hirsuta]|uniref:Mss4-like protein n=1 Tax=Lasiosphaeris hirsuta TaxID=260670 RepID=A0AA40AZP1_9PEZI|nr:Mss4-like protein [Lasiosphaeris hirsuta]